MLPHSWDRNPTTEATLSHHISQDHIPLGIVAVVTAWGAAAITRIVAVITPDQVSQWGSALASVVVAMGGAIIFLVRYWQNSGHKQAVQSEEIGEKIGRSAGRIEGIKEERERR